MYIQLDARSHSSGQLFRHHRSRQACDCLCARRSKGARKCPFVALSPSASSFFLVCRLVSLVFANASFLRRLRALNRRRNGLEASLVRPVALAPPHPATDETILRWQRTV